MCVTSFNWLIKLLEPRAGVQTFCALVTSLCVHLLSHRARSTLPDDAMDQCSVCGSQVCLQWMDWLVCHWLLILVIDIWTWKSTNVSRNDGSPCCQNIIVSIYRFSPVEPSMVNWTWVNQCFGMVWNLSRPGHKCGDIIWREQHSASTQHSSFDS